MMNEYQHQEQQQIDDDDSPSGVVEDDSTITATAEGGGSTAAAAAALSSSQQQQPNSSNTTTTTTNPRNASLKRTFSMKRGGGGGGGSPSNTPHHHRRTSTECDLLSGAVGGAREQICVVRDANSQRPMTAVERRRMHLKKKFGATRTKKEEEEEEKGRRRNKKGRDGETRSRNSSTGSTWQIVDEEENVGSGKPRQYRLIAQRKKSGSVYNQTMHFFGLSGGGNFNPSSTEYDTGGSSPLFCCGIVNPSMLVYRYLHWTFRTTFPELILSCLVAWYVLVIVFAGLMHAAGTVHPHCISVGGIDFGEEGTGFADAFHLSWTTFSTVGYGLVYAGISVGNVHHQADCVFLNFLCTFEAFVGILFSSMVGAIVIGKVARIQSFAQVIFSEPMVIRFGSGITVTDDDDDQTNNSTNSKSNNNNNTTTMNGTNLNGNDPIIMQKQKENIPCPVLEFRIVNRLYGVIGGEIMDASLNCVASIDEKHADPSLRGSTNVRQHRRGGKKRRRKRVINNHRPVLRIDETRATTTTTTMTGDLDLESGWNVNTTGNTDDDDDDAILVDTHLTLTSPSQIQATRNKQRLDEDPACKGTSPLFFSKLEVESPDHPFFKRVWLVRHVLDAHSPLLTRHARQLVRQNHGFWPVKLNTYEGIRSAIQFKQILVSFSGTSNVNASSVHAQKIYDFSFVNVGYRFANMLYRADDGSLSVDLSFINDIMVQNGGGAEPFQWDKNSSARDFNFSLQ